MIPVRYLSKLGDCNDISIGNVPVRVKYVDNEGVINSNGVLPKVGQIIGLDFKSSSSTSSSTATSYDLIILCWEDICACIRALVINLGYMGNEVPNKLQEILKDANTCFVTPTSLPSTDYSIHSVEIGEFAARANKQPELIGLGLSDLARVLGVAYEGPKASSSSSAVKRLKTTKEIEVEQKYMKVLTPAQVKTAITDAYMCYKIASKLLPVVRQPIY